jgi:GNAT superfamily N-acetyltransferase
MRTASMANRRSWCCRNNTIVTKPQGNAPFTLLELDEDHPRWPEFVQCLNWVAPEQAQFVLGQYSRDLPCYLCVALQDGEVVGFLRFGIQPIGPEAGCPPLVLDGVELTEAKIHAFAVREERREQGIGKALQSWAICRANSLGCYQIASHSRYEREANFHVKLSLGFAAQPGNGSVQFLMPLRRG